MKKSLKPRVGSLIAEAVNMLFPNSKCPRFKNKPECEVINVKMSYICTRI